MISNIQPPNHRWQSRSPALLSTLFKSIVLSAPIVLISAISTRAQEIPQQSPVRIYGDQPVLQLPTDKTRPEALEPLTSGVRVDEFRFQRLETVEESDLPFNSWSTTLPVELPNGQEATATFHGSTEFPYREPGVATQRGFTLPEEQFRFSTDPAFLRDSGLEGIEAYDALTRTGEGPIVNPTEFGTEFIQGGMSTGANWVVIKNEVGEVIYEGTPPTYGAQIYWNGESAEITDAEYLYLGEGEYITNTEQEIEQTGEAVTQDTRSRQEVVENSGVMEGQRTWTETDTQQRVEVTTSQQPFQTQQVTEEEETFDADLTTLFPLQNVPILKWASEGRERLEVTPGFQLTGGVDDTGQVSLAAAVQVPIDEEFGTSRVGLAIGGSPGSDDPGETDFYGLLFLQLNTPLFRVVDGDYVPAPTVAGVRLGGGGFHVPYASRTVTQTATVSGVELVSKQQVFADTTLTQFGQTSRTPFTRQTINQYQDTYQVTTAFFAPIITETTEVLVTRPDGSTLIAGPEYQTVEVSQGDPFARTSESLLNTELIASSQSMSLGKPQYSDPFILSQQTTSNLVAVDTASQRVVQNVAVTSTSTERDSAWGSILFLNPYVGNFHLAAISQPGTFLYELGGNLVRSSLLDNQDFDNSNLYLTGGVPLLSPASGGNSTDLSLTIRGYVNYFPWQSDVRAGVRLELTGL